MSKSELINYFQNKRNTKNPILLIHGFSSGWEEWLEVIKILGKEKTIIAVDIPGHGKSLKLEKYSLENYSEPLIDFSYKHFKEPFDVIGHSLGGLIAIFVASKLNNLVRNLVLEDPPIIEKRNNKPSIIELLDQEAKEKINWKNLNDAEEYIKKIDPEISENKLKIRSKNKFLADIKAYDFTFLNENISTPNLLKNIKSRTLLTFGDPEFGGILSADDAKTISTLIPKCSIKKWQLTGHGIHNEHTNKYCEMIKKFIV